MSAKQTPSIDKLILLVLVLILVCLVLLVVQGQLNHARVPAAPAAAAQTEESPVSPAPPTDSVAPTLTSPAKTRSPVTTNVVRRAPAASPPSVAPPPPNDRPVLAEVAGDAAAPGREAETGPLAGVGTTIPSKNKSAAQILGRVWISGTLPPEASLTLTDPVCGRLQTDPITSRHYVVTSDGRLADVLVYVKRGLEGYQFPVSTNVPVLDNNKCLFEPYIMGVQVGQKFAIKNSDPTLHNAHATARSNREFNVALAANGPIITRSFATPEILVRIKCDVHPWMFAYVGVVAHPFFAVTDKDGAFALPPNLPPGTYTLAAYHPKAGEQTKEITIGEGEVKTVEFQYQVNTLSQTK